MHKVVLFIILLVVLLFGVVISEGVSEASVLARYDAMPTRPPDAGLLQKSSDRDLSKTIGVLKRRLKNHQLPEKAIHKLSTMSDEQYRLVTLLCNRISGNGDSAGADVALLLVTALIVLS